MVGGRSVDVAVPPAEEGGGPGCSVRALLATLRERWPAFDGTLVAPDGGLVRHVNLFVDGRSVRWLPEGLETRLAPGCRVDIFPPVAGG